MIPFSSADILFLFFILLLKPSNNCLKLDYLSLKLFKHEFFVKISIIFVSRQLFQSLLQIFVDSDVAVDSFFEFFIFLPVKLELLVSWLCFRSVQTFTL